MLQHLFTTTILAAGIAAGIPMHTARAQAIPCSVDPATGNTICDPTSFHVGSPTATGSEPVLLNDSNTFTISVVGNHDISQPIRVYFIEPLGSALPTITSASGSGSGGNFSFGATSTATATAFDQANGTFDGPTVTLTAGQDFGKQMNLPGADASVSFTNIAAEYVKLGLTVPKTFVLEDAVFPVAFNSDTNFITLNGSFGLGTVIAPLAVNVETQSNGKLKITTFDTSWTNAGFVNQTSVVPEPRTWVMMVAGFGLIGLLGRRRYAGLRQASSGVASLH